jgi:hypothetical protein
LIFRRSSEVKENGEPVPGSSSEITEWMKIKASTASGE